ncbi:MAG TPA: PEP-CTERM sorting domain-containing protein, partial [Flavobacteriales bacterium]|nr:PEP-CTERM sorting domain-containing protein [Flavobacteriales bacterium]
PEFNAGGTGDLLDSGWGSDHDVPLPNIVLYASSSSSNLSVPEPSTGAMLALAAALLGLHHHRRKRMLRSQQ